MANLLKEGLENTNIYPTVPTAPYLPEDTKTFRLTNITEMQRALEADLSRYMKAKRRYSCVFNTISHVNSGVSTASALGAGTSVGLLASGIGAGVSVVLGGVSAALGVTSLGLTSANKKVMLKLQKHTAIVQLVTAKLSSFKLIISKALDDSDITDEEFKRLQADYDDYKRQKFDLQKKSLSLVSKGVDTEAIKQECLKQVNATLNYRLKT